MTVFGQLLKLLRVAPLEFVHCEPYVLCAVFGNHENAVTRDRDNQILYADHSHRDFVRTHIVINNIVVAIREYGFSCVTYAGSNRSTCISSSCSRARARS